MRSVFTNGDAMMRISDLKFSYPDGGFHLEVDKLRIDLHPREMTNMRALVEQHAAGTVKNRVHVLRSC